MKDIMEEFDNLPDDYLRGATSTKDLTAIKSFLSSSLDKAYEAGRQEAGFAAKKALSDTVVEIAELPAKIRQEERERILKLIDEMKKVHPLLIGEVCQECQEICRGNCDCDVPTGSWNSALTSLKEQIKSNEIN